MRRNLSPCRQMNAENCIMRMAKRGKEMAVRIRMKRTGGTNNSCFRVVVMDQCAQRDGKAIEEIGFYNPNSKVETLKVDRYDYWVSVGAQPSETVQSVANRVKNNISLADLVRKPTISKKAKAKAEAEAKAKAEAEAAAAAAAEAPAEEVDLADIAEAVS